MGHYSAFTVAFAIANVLSGAFADDADTFSMTNVEVWQRDSEMQLSISANDGDIVPLTYTVIPLTSDIGLNESLTTRGKVSLQGKLALADDTTYTSLSGSDVIPYLCCDQMNNSYIQPSTMLNYLINNDPQPMAILLYSQQGQCCGLSGDNLNYQKFLTMPNADMASQVEGLVGSAAGTIRATVSGNFTQTSDDDDSQQGGSNSAIAMSVLYSITGVITLLFLVIIGTGAVRAHRYPERYGPRNGFGGRARQSRAKGIARAMLETLPIVKFGASEEPAKPDPNIELENASTETHANDNTPRHLSTIPESPIAPHANTEIVGDNASALSSGQENKGTSETNNTHTDSESADALGCSICTDDFTVGEDVRVLPCNHKFHPQCVDPWLVNVSGTCPLCRLDLRPEEDQLENENGEAPPLEQAESNGRGGSPSPNRRRSRFFDLAQLRHAPVEERIEVLRRYRSQQSPRPSASNDEESRGRARLTDRLRDRFHIRTRTAQP